MKQVVLKHALAARPCADDFALVEVDAPTCPEGGVLVRVAHLSLDPYVGSRLRGKHMGEPAPRPGVDAIPGAAVCQVLESKAIGIKVGDWVHAMEVGWREVANLGPGTFRLLNPKTAPLAAHAGVLGMPGLTAWAGMTQLAKVGPGDVVLVDAAAGPVGGTVGQIARIKGAKRIVGIAGGAQKCALVTDTYGFDACIDYKRDGWEQALSEALPEPPTVYFENVSTEMASKALMRLAAYGRMVLCGLVDQYHADLPPPGLNAGLIVGKRAQVMGLVVYDFYPLWDAFVKEAGTWIADGSLVFKEDRAIGLEAAPALFERLMHGQNVGKAVVSVSPE
ncbi:MAG: NADP-dependent oxidoreductase [Aquidulcibacter sp.]|jgi:NADPH-dependent curcumin reductase CurA|uniref:MDR family NADP-dependent oxidoreductase n=1 Tax=Aquidulcibacter sp. TaxID=2052990 RepID=UPI0022BC2E5A|nr:NADP-dependent oxidoreductase [Aquidulcibacter sp.]MCZ8209215.1 NADP-dependent oxidoreductase [Aquidulcibacter sp.]